MTKNRNIEPENGVLTSSMNVKNREFKEFQVFLSNKANSLSREQKLQIELFALQIKSLDIHSSQK